MLNDFRKKWGEWGGPSRLGSILVGVGLLLCVGRAIYLYVYPVSAPTPDEFFARNPHLFRGDVAQKPREKIDSKIALDLKLGARIEADLKRDLTLVSGKKKQLDYHAKGSLKAHVIKKEGDQFTAIVVPSVSELKGAFISKNEGGPSKHSGKGLPSGLALIFDSKGELRAALSKEAKPDADTLFFVIDGFNEWMSLIAYPGKKEWTDEYYEKGERKKIQYSVKEEADASISIEGKSEYDSKSDPAPSQAALGQLSLRIMNSMDQAFRWSYKSGYPTLQRKRVYSLPLERWVARQGVRKSRN